MNLPSVIGNFLAFLRYLHHTISPTTSIIYAAATDIVISTAFVTVEPSAFRLFGKKPSLAAKYKCVSRNALPRNNPTLFYSR